MIEVRDRHLDIGDGWMRPLKEDLRQSKIHSNYLYTYVYLSKTSLVSLIIANLVAETPMSGIVFTTYSYV